ncbi:MAG: class I SAM-dependent methyltransferase [Deltaproteobacteria bacterium]|nr:class I SAM-dependent methyltransferase [Deltaproteobacteria bacterium]
MNPKNSNRFEDFFADDAYVSLKNHLYNYLLRRRAVRKQLEKGQDGLVLEVGSGLSPMAEASDRIVYSEISFPALRTLKRREAAGHYVVADAGSLPFKSGSFSQVICSEVLEHLPDDRQALKQIRSVLKPGGALILTFPHRRSYFAGDDRFVSHFRRYDLGDMITNLAAAGLEAAGTQKVLGPLEKITMLSIISLVPFFERLRKMKLARKHKQGALSESLVLLFGWVNRLYCLPVWLDARLAPQCLSSVLLIQAFKRNDR